jgi:hypothetical protein
MKKVHDPDPVCGPYRWDGRGGHARLNPNPLAIETEPGVIRVSRYLVWMDGLGCLCDASSLEEAQAVLDSHWGAAALAQGDEEQG